MKTKVNGKKTGDKNRAVNTSKNQLIGSGILLLTAFIWGMAFTAQSSSMDYIGPFTMNCTRSILGGLALLPLIIWQRVKAKGGAAAAERTSEENCEGAETTGVSETAGVSEKSAEVSGEAAGVSGKSVGPWNETVRATVIGGICCGAILAVASSLQQIGICYTSVGKAGFITTLYIVMVPLMGVFWHRKIGGKVWFSVGLAAVGMYLLCMNESFTINPGDAYVFCCAIAFTGHILVIDHFSPKADCVVMSCIQFFTCALLCGAAMFIFEEPAWENIFAAKWAILYAGVLSSGAGYTLQIIGQKHTDPVVASLIMSLESVFAALGGWMILGQTLSGRELLGCAVVFVGIMLVQLPDKKRAA